MQRALRPIATLIVLVFALLVLAPVIASLARAHEPFSQFREHETGGI